MIYIISYKNQQLEVKCHYNEITQDIIDLHQNSIGCNGALTINDVNLHRYHQIYQEEAKDTSLIFYNVNVDNDHREEDLEELIKDYKIKCRFEHIANILNETIKKNTNSA
jgi:hypothetical protein